MTPEEHIKKFSKTIREAESHYNGQIMALLGHDARQMIYDRVHGKGIMANGQKYPEYSRKDMLIGKKSARTKAIENLLFGSKKKRAAMDWVTLGGSRYSQYLSASAGENIDLRRLAILKGGYRKLRQLWGLQVNHVDFSVTGQMWSDIGVISSSTDHRNGTVIIGAKDSENRKILEGNTKRKGEILDLRMREIEELMKTYNLQVLQIFKNNGL